MGVCPQFLSMMLCCQTYPHPFLTWRGGGPAHRGGGCPPPRGVLSRGSSNASRGRHRGSRNSASSLWSHHLERTPETPGHARPPSFRQKINVGDEHSMSDTHSPLCKSHSQVRTLLQRQHLLYRTRPLPRGPCGSSSLQSALSELTPTPLALGTAPRASDFLFPHLLGGSPYPSDRAC